MTIASLTGWSCGSETGGGLLSKHSQLRRTAELLTILSSQPAVARKLQGKETDTSWNTLKWVVLRLHEIILWNTISCRWPAT
jgi:hypothetical protein